VSDLPRFKLHARNLTARADLIVAGNAVTTRPESGVENCFPGLEFDQRNLDKRFFPGLVFELHHSGGVILREFALESGAGEYFNEGQLSEEGVFLAYLRGQFTSHVRTAPAPRVISLLPPAGLTAWRAVRDLEPGDVGIILADAAAFTALRDADLSPDAVAGTLAIPENRSQAFGRGKIAFMFARRTAFLDAEGVIALNAAAPGELTQSLCAPWQYDFADCGCFYWASNKPDLVSSDAQAAQVLNFQRRARAAQDDAAAASSDWITKLGGAWDDPDEHIYTHAETMRHWGELPFVIARKETDRYEAAAPLQGGSLLSRGEVIGRLRKLAAVEHALAVEYLYAHYSFGLPLAGPAEAPEDLQKQFAAARNLFDVAVDEMRHLRAVNELLVDLGEPSTLERAKVIGEDFDGPGTGFKHLFTLRPCVPQHLDWFIRVEAQSQVATGEQSTIDGMYTLILRSVVEGGEFSDVEGVRVARAVKVIIDEGVDHYRRFVDAKRQLAGMAPVSYLKVKDGKPKLAKAGTPERALQDVVDSAYLSVLRSLDFVFQLGDKQRGALVEAARRAMYNMDDAARVLSAKGVGATFDYERIGAIDTAALGAGLVAGDPEAGIARIGQPLRDALDRLTGEPDLSRRMRARQQELEATFRRLTGEAS
jgi:hypothetical protein